MFAPSPPVYGPVERMVDQMYAQQERERLERFKRQWEYYHGRHKKPLKVRPDQADDNVIVNPARAAVNKAVSFLFGKPLSFVLPAGRDGTADDAPTPAERWLAECWAFNKQDSLLLGLGLNGSVNGHGFLKIQQIKPGEKYPRLVNLDPATVTPGYDPHDIRDILGWTIQYTGVDTRPDSPSRGRKVVFRQTLTRLPSGQGWQIVDWESLADAARWTQTGTAMWPYPFSPIAHCQNLPNPNEWWGVSDLEADVLGLIDSRNFLLSNTQRIIRYHAHPKTVGKGFRKEDLDVAVDATIILPNKDAELKNLEMQSDLASTLNFDTRLDEGHHQLTRIPPVTVGKLEGIGRLSGAAISLLHGPLVEMTETKRTMYGQDGILGDVCSAFLVMGGFDPQADKATITWPEMLPQDVLEQRQALLLDQQMGVVSNQTVAEKLGYDWEQEQERRAEEAQNVGSTLLDQMASGTALGAQQQDMATKRLANPTPGLGQRGGISQGGGQNG